MLNHRLTTALRHFRRHKATTSVNILCLGLGLTCFLVAWGITAYFSNTDSYRKNAARTYLVITKSAVSKSEPVLPVGSPLLAEHLATDFPELDAVARATAPQEVPVAVNDSSRFARVVYVDPQFLSIFHLPVIRTAATDAATLLNGPRSAIVSRAFATKFFGTDRVVGRTFRISGGKGSGPMVTISGVLGKIRQPSQMTTDTTTPAAPFGLQFDILLPMDLNPARDLKQTWTTRTCFTYVMLPGDGSLTVSVFNDQLDAFAERHVPPDRAGGPLEFRARPVSDILRMTLDSMVGTSTTGVSGTAVLMILGGLVLLVACFNYANLATAQSLTRTREIAVRRVLGAGRRQLIVQHMVEGLLLTGAALLVSLACIAVIVLAVNTSTFIAVVRIFAPLPQFWIFLAGLVVLVTFAADAYPTVVLCGVRPAYAPQGVSSRGGARSLAKMLVALQFAFAGFLLIAVLVMSAQSRAMKRAVWNPRNDPVVVIANDVLGENVNKEVLKEELSRQPGVTAVGEMEYAPWSANFRLVQLSSSADASASRVRTSEEIVDADIFEAMSIGVLAGRVFDRRRAADTANVGAWRRADSSGATDYNVVIDRAMVERLGFGSPRRAVGKIIYRPTSRSGSAPPQRLHVIGVVENAVIQPVNLGAPSIYLMNSDAATVPVIRISKRSVPAVLAGIDRVWAKLAPGVPLRRRFADEQYEASYGFLNVIDRVFAFLGSFALVIATMGLIGMAMHLMQRRTKEIAVRKVVGASAGQIRRLLLGSIAKPIAIANLAVWPVAYVVMRGYLSLFAVRSGLGLIPFLLSLATMLVVAWLAVLSQASRAARTRPATALRCE